MSALELGLVGALGAVGLLLAGVVATMVVRRRRPPTPEPGPPTARQVHADLGEDPIVSALGVGDTEGHRGPNGRP